MDGTLASSDIDIESSDVLESFLPIVSSRVVLNESSLSAIKGDAFEMKQLSDMMI